ncbi:MAG: GNAT family N-acetyltransferase, partial [Planctomycetaceae bacterium]
MSTMLDPTPAESVAAPLALDLLGAGDAPLAFAEWSRLESRLADVPLAASRAWTETWLAHYGDLVPHRFAVGRRNGAASAIALLSQGVGQSEGPFRVRTVHLGTAGEPESESVCVEFNALLSEPDCVGEFLQRLLEHLASERDWDELRLDGFALDGAAALFDTAPFLIEERPSHYFDLAAARSAGETAYQRLGSATRKNLRKNLNAYGTLQTEWAETPDQAEAIFADLVRLHQARWTAAGQPGVYASERFTRFHQALIARLLPNGKLALFRVRSGGETVGCVQLLIDRNRALCYQGGCAPYRGKQSPGLIADYLCIEECLRRGLAAYDFLA